MSRLKYEEQFKKKLEKHEVEPSAGSWNKLESRLDAEGKKAFSKYGWMKIAASIVGGILILNVVFNDNKLQNEPAIVKSPSEEIGKEKIMIPKLEAQPIVSEEIEKSVVEGVSELIPERNITIKHASAITETSEFEIAPTPNQVNSTLISKKLEEVIAKISSEEKEDNSVTNAEIDALLAKAAVEISRENKFEYVENNNAEALLWEVEMELEESFRAKIFQLLKEGYLKAKTAVATRNN